MDWLTQNIHTHIIPNGLFDRYRNFANKPYIHIICECVVYLYRLMAGKENGEIIVDRT